MNRLDITGDPFHREWNYTIRPRLLAPAQPAKQQPGEHVNVETLAQQLGGLSRNHLHKIVQDLSTLGVLRTVRGPAAASCWPSLSRTSGLAP